MRQSKCGLRRLAEAFFMGCCLLIGREYIMLLADNDAEQGKTMYTVFRLITFLTIIAAGDPRCYLPSLITPSVVVQFICSFLVFGLSGGGTYTLIVQCVILALGAVMNTLLLLQAATEFSNNAATTLAFLCGCVFSYELADICNALPWFRRNMFMRLVLREFPSHALIQTKCAAMAAAITMRYALGEQCSFYSVDLWKFYKAHKNAFVEWRSHPLFGLILRERSMKMMPLYTCMAILIAIIGALPPHAQLFKLPLANYRLMYIAGFEEWALGAGVLMGAILPFPRSCKFMLHVTVLVMCLLNTLHVPIYMHFTSLTMLKPYTLTWLCIVTSFLEGYALSYGIGQLVSIGFLRGCSGVLVSKSCCEAIADAQCFCKQKADNFECRGRYDPSRAKSPCAKQKSPTVSTNHIIWVKKCDNTNNMGRCFPLKCKCKGTGDGAQGKVQKTCVECTICSKKKSDCKNLELIPVTCTKKIAAADEKGTKAEENQQNEGGSGDSSTSKAATTTTPSPVKPQGGDVVQQQQESPPPCAEAQGGAAAPNAAAAKAPVKEEKTKPETEKATGVEAKDGKKKKKKRESKCFCKNVGGAYCATDCSGCGCATEQEYEDEDKIEEEKRQAACKKLKCVEWITTQQAQHYVLRNAQSSTCDDCDLTLLLEAVPVGNRTEMCCLSTVEEPPFTCCWQEWNPDMDRLYIGYLDADCPLCSIVEVRTMDFAKEYSYSLNESFPHHFNVRSMEFGSCCHSTFYLKMLCDKRDKYPHLHRRKYSFKNHPISYVYFTTAAVMNEEVEKLKSKRGQSSTASSALPSSTAAASTGSSGAPGAPSGAGGAGGAGDSSSSAPAPAPGPVPSPAPSSAPGSSNGGGSSGGARASQGSGQNGAQSGGSALQPASDPSKTCDENGNLVSTSSTEFLVDQKYKTCCFGVATRLFAYYRYVTEMNGCNYCVTDKCDESRQPAHCNCKGGKCSIGCCVKVQFTDEISTQNIANQYRYISIVCFFALCFVMQLILTYIYHSFTGPSSAVYCDFGVHMQSITKGGWKGAIRAQLANPQSEVFTVQHHDTEKGLAKLVQPLELFIPGNVNTFATWVKAQVASVFPEFVRVYDLKMYYTACTALCMYTMRKCFEVVEPLIRLHLQRWERRWEKEFACYKESLVGALEKSAHMSRLAQVMRYEMGSFMYNAVPDLPDGAWTALIDEIKMYQWITEHEQRLQKKRRSGDYDSQLTIRQVLNKVWRKRLRLIRRLEEQRRAVFHWQGLTDSYEMLKKFYAQQDLAFGVTEEPADDADDFPVGDDSYTDATPHTDTATQSHTETN